MVNPKTLHRCALLAALLLTACGGPPRTSQTVTATGPAPASVSPPNPATQNCLALGGTSVQQSGPGGQTGYCALPGGALVEEWALYRETRG